MRPQYRPHWPGGIRPLWRDRYRVGLMDADLDAARAADDWVFVTRIVAAAQRRAVERIEASGLPAQDFAALQLLLRSPYHRLSMTYIARDLAMTTGGLTKLADRLGRAGLIDRRGTSSDRRRRFAGLTPAGLELAQQTAREFAAGVRAHIVDIIGADQLSAVADTLRLLDPARSPEPEAEIEVELEPMPPRDPSLPDRRKRTEPPPHE